MSDRPHYKGEKPSRMRVEIALIVLGIVFALLSVLFWPKEAGASEQPVIETDVPALVQTASEPEDEGEDGPSWWDQVRDKFTAMSEDEERLLEQRAALEEMEARLSEREAQLDQKAADLAALEEQAHERMSEFVLALRTLDHCAGGAVDRMTEIRDTMFPDGLPDPGGEADTP